MDFNLDEERTMLRDMLRRFFNDNYDHETRRKLINSGDAYDTGLYQQLAELGVLGALFGEDQGGFGGAGSDLSVVFEEVGRAGVIAPLLGNAVLAGHLIARLGDSDQQVSVEDVISGNSILSFAHSEANARYTLRHLATTAEETRGTAILNGVKTQVLNGAEANFLVISARENGDLMDASGISLFLIPADEPGVEIVKQTGIDGTALARVTLTNAKARRLGQKCQAFPVIEEAVSRAVLAICAESLGAMYSAKDLTIEYLKDRRQFGVQIGKFQALQHRMADLLIEVEQAKSAVVNLAGNLEQPRDVRERHVSATKNLVGRVGALVAEECIQMHGGIGMTEEYALSYFARRLVMIDHMFGDVDYHLQRYIAFGQVRS